MAQGYNNNHKRIVRFYVDDLLPECEDQDVRQYFSQFGRVLEAFVSREKDTYLSRCFATVSMQDPAISAKVVGRKDHEIWGCTVNVKSVMPTEEERPDTHVPLPPPIGQALEECGRFFATGLTQDIYDRDLREYFGKFGEVSDCIVANDEAGCRVAAIRMTDPFAVGSVLEEERHEVKGQHLKVSEKLEKPIKPQLGVRAPPPAPAPPGYGGNPNDNEPGKFFVGGCSRSTSEEELWSYFGTIGKISELNMVKDKMTGMSKGCAFVTFAEPSEELRKEMVERTHTIRDQVIRVDEARRKPGKGTGKGKGYDSYGGGGGWDSYNTNSNKGGWSEAGKGYGKSWGSDWNSNEAWQDSAWGGKSQGGKGKGDGKSWGAQDWGQSWGSHDQGSRGWGGQSKGAWGDASGGKGSKRSSDDRGDYGGGNGDEFSQMSELPRKRQDFGWRDNNASYQAQGDGPIGAAPVWG
jgi:RNA recognition motif-containing protein